ncbi:MAG: pilus assembly protein, partial [Acidobacteria bacterium]
MAILVDTGPLYALCDQDDQYHGLVKRFVKKVHETL